MPSGEVCQNDASAMRFDDIASTHIVRPIVSLDENMRQNGLDQSPRLVLVKNNYSIDSAQSGKDRRAVALRIDWSAGAFNPKHRGIAIQADNQCVTLGPRKFQVLNMAAVENVKTTVREDEFPSGCIESITQLPRFRHRQDFRAHTIPEFGRWAIAQPFVA